MKIEALEKADEKLGVGALHTREHRGAEWLQILPTSKLIRENSSWDAPDVFSGTAWARVTNVEGVKPHNWPVKKCRTC